jgi:3-hydroxyacyl-CoA dehydrogenase
MHYADGIGLAHLRDRLTAFADRTGDERHRPAPLLQELAAAGKGFASLEE